MKDISEANTRLNNMETNIAHNLMKAFPALTSLQAVNLALLMLEGSNGISYINTAFRKSYSSNSHDATVYLEQAMQVIYKGN